MQDLEPGQVIDGFRLDEPLDPGGMASFWRVSRPATDMPLLMKIPLMRRGEDPITIVGFEVEQMILARLSGPHVPRFIAAGDFERPYIVMEYVAGLSVRSLLAKTPLPPDDVAEIGAKVAFALHDLHRQHVIHLDLKPSNIILRDNGEAVLIDFGLSRHDQLPDLVGEEFDDPVGTGPYVAPEQVLRDRGDPRSDIFALGVILYFLATGERPFGEPQRAAEWRRGIATSRRGCRRSSCAVSRSTPTRATPLPRSSPSTSSIPSRWRSPHAPSARTATDSWRWRLRSAAFARGISGRPAGRRSPAFCRARRSSWRPSSSRPKAPNCAMRSSLRCAACSRPSRRRGLPASTY